MPHSEIPRGTRKRAQALRRKPTDAEHRLWQVLRSLTSLGMHFRRQAPIGIYVADFAWYAGKLVIEVDGGQHAELQKEYDATRTRWLESQGYRVLRFWNNDVLQHTAGVAEVIISASKGPTPDPSPQGGGERAALGELK